MRVGLGAGVALVIGAAAVALALIGRDEQARSIRVKQMELANAYALVGNRLDAPNLSTYRLPGGDLRCLVYRVEDHPYGLELCFDQRDCLVEAVDRRRQDPRYYTLAPEDAHPTVCVDGAEVSRLIDEINEASE